MALPIPADFESSLTRKLQDWLDRQIERAGLPNDLPIRWENFGQEIPEGKYLLAVVDSPTPHPDFENHGLGVAPMLSTVMLVLVQPAVNKTINTPEAIDAFDKLGRKIALHFRDRANLNYNEGWVSINHLAYKGEGGSDDGVDDAGRRVRIYSVKFQADFCEAPEPE